MNYHQAEMSPEALALQFSNFIEEDHRLKNKYSGQISLLVGAETEFISSKDMDSLSRLMQVSGDKIEYLVGSVHHANEIPIDFDRETFDTALRSFATACAADTMELLIENYLDRQYELLNRFQPAVIGHFDLFRLYNPSLRLESFPNLIPKLERNISYACSYGALFELNAAAFRKGWDEAYPAKDVIDVSLDAELSLLKLTQRRSWWRIMVGLLCPMTAMDHMQWA